MAPQPLLPFKLSIEIEGVMAYLYAGLGIAMMVGIMTVFEIASSFDQQQLTADSGSRAQAAAYFADSDLTAFNKLRSLSPPASLETCTEIASSIGLNSYSVAASSGFFRCIMESFQRHNDSGREYAHRVLIDSENNYWSCFYERNPYTPNQCSFE